MRRFPICSAEGREDRVRMAREGGRAENGCSVNQALGRVHALLTVCAVALLELISGTGLRVPNPAVILVLTTVFSAFSGWLRAGPISAALGWFYLAYFLDEPGRGLAYAGDNLRWLVIWAVSLPAILVMIGTRKRRAEYRSDEVVRRERDRSTGLETALAERRRSEESLHALFDRNLASMFRSRRGKVRGILAIKGEHVHTIEPDRTILDAVVLLVEHGTGALLVRDAGGAVAGIISERDVLRLCRDRSRALDSMRIGDVMTRDLVICVPDDDIDYAMGIVTKNRVRHLPVMDGDRVAGMISIGDLVKARLDGAEYENRSLREYIEALSDVRRVKLT